MFTERCHRTFTVARVWKFLFSGSPKKKKKKKIEAPVQQAAPGTRSTRHRTGGRPGANMWGGVQWAVKLLGNVPPVHSPLHLANSADTPGWNKSRRPHREKPFAGPLGHLRRSAHSWCFSCRGSRWGGLPEVTCTRGPLTRRSHGPV